MDKFGMERYPQVMSLSSFSDENLERYFRVLKEGVAVNSHSDLLRWLQGEIQHYLPHEIMLAIWFDVGENSLRHDLVSALPGVRTGYLQSEDFRALHQRFHGCWVGLGRIPFRFNLEACSFRAGFFAPPCAFAEAIYGMQSLVVHGISDARSAQDCLYLIFSSAASLNNTTLAAMAYLLPYLDTTLRRVTPLSCQHDHILRLVTDMPARRSNFRLTAREVEILHWVGIGKTNRHIATILEISFSTVKSHLRSIFQKLRVHNRAQAIAKLGPTHVIASSEPRFPAIQVKSRKDFAASAPTL